MKSNNDMTIGIYCRVKPETRLWFDSQCRESNIGLAATIARLIELHQHVVDGGPRPDWLPPQK